MARSDNHNGIDQTGIGQLAWVKSLHAGLDQSNSMIRTAPIQEGWDVVHHRGRVIREAMRCFYEQVVSEVSPRGAFAIHALGGTGRQEICPGSDVDIGILVENIEENEHFFRHVSRQLQQFAPLVPGLRAVVKANAIPDLKDIEHFDLKSLVALLDGDLLVGDTALNDRVRRVCQQRATELRLEFIFEVHEDFRQFDLQWPHQVGDIGGFHVKDGIGGLRNFQMTMWLYSFERWIPSVEVYRQVRGTRRFDNEGAPMPEVLEAVGIVFSARCWIHQHRADQRLSENSNTANAKRQPGLVIGVDDMESFLARFGAEGLTELNRAREIIHSYRHDAWDRLLERGVVVPDTDGLVVWRPDGLRIGSDAMFKDTTKMFYTLYSASQQFRLPIDQRTKRAARKNIAQSIRADEGFVKLLVQPGSVFSALKDWFDFGVLDKLLPGFRQLSQQLYRPGHRTATLTRAARAMQRLQNLDFLFTAQPSDVGPREAYFLRQCRDIGESGRCSLRLALLTEEIPETLYPNAVTYSDAVKEYVDQCLADVPGLSPSMLQAIEFLLLTKRQLLESAETGDQEHVVENWREKITKLNSGDSANTIRALALFAYAAFDFRKLQEARNVRLHSEQWQNVQNLTQNLLYEELGVGGKPFEDHYFDETGRRIGQLLPRRLLASPHVDNSLIQTYDGAELLDPQRAHRIIYAFKNVLQTGQPRVELARDDEYYRLTLYAWEFSGLFWRIAGAVYEKGCSIRSTDLYSVPDPSGEAEDGETLIPNERRLIFDVLTFDAPSNVDESWEADMKERVHRRLENCNEQIPDNTSDILEPVMDVLRPQLTDLGGGQVKLSCHSPADYKGTRYAISRLLSERAGASIESITRDGTRDWPIPRTNFYVRAEIDIKELAESLRNDLGEVPVDIDAL